MNVLELSEQEIGRRESLQQLRQMGINPYPAAEFPVNAWSTDIFENFEDLPVIKAMIFARPLHQRTAAW